MPGLVAATAFLLFVLFNRQAFFNYYWLVIGLLAAATAAAGPDDVEVDLSLEQGSG